VFIGSVCKTVARERTVGVPHELDVYAAPISGTANLMLLVRWAGAYRDRCRARAMERTWRIERSPLRN
jgi:hypothetical protein